MRVGDTVRWHVRPEVHVEHGGYMQTKPLTGIVRSVYPTHIMVGTEQLVIEWGRGAREMRYAVCHGNPSLGTTDHHAKPKELFA